MIVLLRNTVARNRGRMLSVFTVMNPFFSGQFLLIHRFLWQPLFFSEGFWKTPWWIWSHVLDISKMYILIYLFNVLGNVCVSVCASGPLISSCAPYWMQVPIETRNRSQSSMELEFWVVVRQLMWMQGASSGSSARSMSTLHYWAAPPAPFWVIFISTSWLCHEAGTSSVFTIFFVFMTTTMATQDWCNVG